jgi:hypothetical protein
MAATLVSSDYLIKKTVISTSKSEKGFKITVTVLYTLNGPMLEFEARRLPYLDRLLLRTADPSPYWPQQLCGCDNFLFTV